MSCRSKQCLKHSTSAQLILHRNADGALAEGAAANFYRPGYQPDRTISHLEGYLMQALPIQRQALAEFAPGLAADADLSARGLASEHMPSISRPALAVA